MAETLRPPNTTDEIESMTDSFFQRVYTGEQSIDEAIAALARFNSSADTREQEVFTRVVRNLFDEQRFLHNYPEKELRITGILFGSLVRHRLVSAITLGIALRHVLEALRCSPGPPPPGSSEVAGGKIFRFGMLALEQFKGRVGEWPQFCGEVVQIPHLVGSQPALVEEIKRIMRGAQGSGGAAGGGGGGAIPLEPEATEAENGGSPRPRSISSRSPSMCSAAWSDDGSDSDGFVVVTDRADFVMVRPPREPREPRTEAAADAASSAAEAVVPAAAARMAPSTAALDGNDQTVETELNEHHVVRHFSATIVRSSGVAEGAVTDATAVPDAAEAPEFDHAEPATTPHIDLPDDLRVGTEVVEFHPAETATATDAAANPTNEHRQGPTVATVSTPPSSRRTSNADATPDKALTQTEIDMAGFASGALEFEDAAEAPPPSGGGASAAPATTAGGESTRSGRPPAPSAALSVPEAAEDEASLGAWAVAPPVASTARRFRVEVSLAPAAVATTRSTSRPTGAAPALASAIARRDATTTISGAAAAASATTAALPPRPPRRILYQHLSSRPTRTRQAAVPLEAPPLPPHYVERSALLRSAVSGLVSAESFERSSFYALRGESGSGKTTLASAIVRDPEVRKVFWRGVFWVSLGQAGCAGQVSVSAWGGGGARGGGAGQRKKVGGDRLRALLRVLVARGAAADPPPSHPRIGTRRGSSPLPASTGEYSRQLLWTNGGADGKRMLVVLDDVGDGDLESLVELEKAGFALLVVSASEGSLAQLRTRWTLLTPALSAPPARRRTSTATTTMPPMPRRDAGRSQAACQQDDTPKAAYMRLLGSMTGNEAAKMLLARARRRQRRSAAETAAARAEEEVGGADGDVWAEDEASAKRVLELVERVGGAMPLALALTSAVAAAEGDGGQRFDNSPPFDAARYRWIERQLRDTYINNDDECCYDEQHVETPSVGIGGYDVGTGTLRTVIKLGFDTLRLERTRDCFVRLGVLPKGAVVGEGMLGSLWEQDSFETARIIEELLAHSLLSETHLGSRFYRIHAPVLAFAKTLLLLHDFPYRRGVAEETEEEATDEEEMAAAAAAAGTREAAVASQARYLGRVDVLLQFSGGGVGGGGGGTGVAEKAEEVARRCGETLLLGGLPALAALWHSLEDLCSVATPLPPLQDAYRAALQDLGVCMEAVSGYWAAAKLLQLQGNDTEAKRMAKHSVRVGLALYNAGAAQSAQLHQEAALLRVHKDKNDEVVDQYEKGIDDLVLAHGPSHPAVACATRNLAGVLMEQGKLTPAEDRYRETLWLLEASFGDDHPLLANALIDVAEAKMEQLELLTGPEDGYKWKEVRAHGMEVCSRALSICDNDLGAANEVLDSRGQASSFVRLAQMLQEQDNIEGAKRLLWRALSILESSNLGSHLQAGTVLVALADLLHQENVTLSGEDRAARELAWHRNNAWSSLRKKDKDEANKMLRRAVRIGESWFQNDPSHEKLALWRVKLAGSFSHQGKHILAAAHYLKVVEHCRTQPSIDQAAIVDAAHRGLAKLVQLANFDELFAHIIAYNDAKGAESATTTAPSGATAAETAGPGGSGGGGGGGGGRDDDSAAVPENTDGEDENEDKEEDGWDEARDVSLEAAVFYLFANNPASQNSDTVASLIDGHEEDDGDRELQLALSLSLQREESSTLQ